MAEESGVEREDAPALNIGETAVVGVADADCSALARPRVTRMADVRGTLGWGKRGGGQVLRGGAEKRRDATRRAPPEPYLMSRLAELRASTGPAR